MAGTFPSLMLQSTRYSITSLPRPSASCLCTSLTVASARFLRSHVRKPWPNVGMQGSTVKTIVGYNHHPVFYDPRRGRLPASVSLLAVTHRMKTMSCNILISRPNFQYSTVERIHPYGLSAIWVAWLGLAHIRDVRAFYHP